MKTLVEVGDVYVISALRTREVHYVGDEGIIRYSIKASNYTIPMSRDTENFLTNLNYVEGKLKFK